LSETETRIVKSDNQLISGKSGKDNRKSVTARIKPEDLVIFNQRLKLFGFNSINEMVQDFIKGNFLKLRKIGRLII
jgi:hypothetical protein